MAQTPRFSVTVTVKVPKNLDQMEDIVSGLMAMAEAHDVDPQKVSTYVTTRDTGVAWIDAYWTTPAVV